MTIRRWLGVVVLVGIWAPAGGLAAQERRPDDPPAEKKEKKKDLMLKLDDKLKFMAGCWQGPIDRETMVEEIWTTPTENLMTSTTRYIRKDRATSFEFSRIMSTDSSVTFSASTEGKPFDEYQMIQVVDEYVVFENTKKTFPQRISYRLASDGNLIPRNEGEGQPAIEVRFKKVKCPGV